MLIGRQCGAPGGRVGSKRFGFGEVGTERPLGRMGGGGGGLSRPVIWWMALLLDFVSQHQDTRSGGWYGELCRYSLRLWAMRAQRALPTRVPPLMRPRWLL